MKTHCPNCSTLYKISEEVLNEADGMARCYRCDTVFNAYENKVVDAPPVLSDSDVIDQQDDQQPELPFDRDTEHDSGFLDSEPLEANYEQDSVFLQADKDELEHAANDDDPPYKVSSQLSPLEVAEEQLHQLSEAPPEPIEEFKEEEVKQDKPVEEEAKSKPEPILKSSFKRIKTTIIDLNKDHRESEDKAAEEVAGDSKVEETPEPEQSEPEKETLVVGDEVITLTKVPTYNPAEYRLQQELEAKESKAKSAWWEYALVALLIVLLFSQIAVAQKESLKKSMLGQAMCGLMGWDCSHPPRRAPKRFQVVQRRIVPDPNIPDVLAMTLTVRNTASFEQELPDMQLALFDLQENLVARRRLSPNEYMVPPPREKVMVGAQEMFSIDLVFEDPGEHVTGFRIEFL